MAVTNSQHYAMFHDLINKPPIYESYTVTCVEQTNVHALDTS